MKTIYTTKNHLGQTNAVIFQYGSTNSKTGTGVQIACIPMSWIEKGKQEMENDSAVCFSCPHSKSQNRSCYVRKGLSNVGMMSKVESLHRAFNSGSLEICDISESPAKEGKFLRGAYVRFGQYGEPVLLGESVVSKIASLASNFTGYTHLWHLPQYAWASRFFMASVETELLTIKAQSKGFRTFRVRSKVDAILSNEVTCPASKEGGRKTSCNLCGLCKGNESKAKSVVIIKH